MTDNILKSIVSATVASTATNYIMKVDAPFTKTYRTYIKPREYGKFNWRFYHSNSTDSTWDDGSSSAANDLGGEWIIEAASMADGGTAPDGSIVPKTAVSFTFDGNEKKAVQKGEVFISDSVTFEIPKDHFIAFTWTLSTKSIGKVLPFNTETLLMSAYEAQGNCTFLESAEEFKASENCTVLPAMLGYEKPVKKRIVFFGDSITQGVRTKVDGYEYWVAKIAEGLGTDYGVWNIGSGWARAYDASTNGSWLKKAKESDELIICLGVNDIGTGKRSYDQLINDLTVIVSEVKKSNPLCSIIMFTVPPFNFVEDEANTWRRINNTIKNNPPKGVDRVFDVAKVLSSPAPNDNIERPEYMSNELDPHPNGLAGTDIADAFLKWYKK